MIQLALCDLRLSKSEEARAVAKQVVALEPANPQARRALGQVLIEAGEYQQGALELETAKRLAPDSAVVRFHLANAYRKLGRKADAEKEWAAFTSLKSKEEVFASTEEKLKGVSEKKGRTQ